MADPNALLQAFLNAANTATPVDSFNRGVETRNLLEQQLLQNQQMKLRNQLTEQMTPLEIAAQEEANRYALATNPLREQVLGQQMQAGQMELDDATRARLGKDLTSLGQSALMIPKGSRKSFVLDRLKTVDFAGLNEGELIDEISGMDEEQLDTYLNDTFKGDQGMTEYQRQSLELEREKMRNKPAEDTRTSDEKNWARYEQLAKTNPEQARLFGTQIGIFDKDGESSSPEQDDLTPLLGNLSPELAQKAQSAYRLAGGGKDGVKALNEIVEKGSEIERRQLAPTILKARFKDATPEEMAQLQSAVDAAKDTESGFKAAAEVRETQRNRKKFIAYQDRAVGLIDRILQNDELEDVLGSFEGTGEAWVSDKEAAAIADIDELRNILTADNLDLMKGVLSNTDIEILKSLSAGATNRKKGEKLFISDMTNLKERLRNANPSGNDIDDLVNKYAD